MLSALLALAAVTAPAPPQPVCVVPDGLTVHLELAISDRERFDGLMYRDHLAADRGMLFIFDQDDVWPFWMKNTFIPLDLLWLDATGKVVEIRADVQPCRTDPCPSYAPLKKGRAVLEVNAGFCKAHGVAVGSQLRFDGIDTYPVKGGAK